MGNLIVIAVDLSEKGLLQGINVLEGGDFVPAVGAIACRGAADFFSAKAKEAEIERRVAAALAQTRRKDNGGKDNGGEDGDYAELTV